MMPRGFASDNNAGIHPEVLAAIGRASVGHAPSYGRDPWTEQAEALFRRHFGETAQGFLVFNGTAANVLALEAFMHPAQAVICGEAAHIMVDEAGAPERFTAGKLLPVRTPDGKLRPEDIARQLQRVGDVHGVQPRVVSVTQATEVGTVYAAEELRHLAETAHRHGLILHLDGARIANAAVHLDLPFRAFTTDVGVDVVSFGGTKNGLMGAEAVIFLNGSAPAAFPWMRKQGMQLASKMRFLAAQFVALLDGDLWQRNAAHANRMARLLAERVRDVPGLTISQPVEANGVFARVSPEHIPPLLAHASFYVWDAVSSEVRWMTSWDTTEDDIEQFARAVRSIIR